MDLAIAACWGLLGVLHAMPSAVFFFPRTLETLYGINSSGDLGVLMVHRAAMFLGIVAVAAYAIFDPDARKVASIFIAISMFGFLFTYARAGMPAGSLRRVAIADLLGLLPLAVVIWAAWFSGS